LERPVGRRGKCPVAKKGTSGRVGTEPEEAFGNYINEKLEKVSTDNTT
jgi:FKBP-type peptidyl-prolyl cis-trans isomerase 2